ncbi:hypothetical protein BCR33DRAFT_580272 [Rhizoclosmatium globosum]|uniref:Uncharacterized protein n=1 Tax=Rhizoclosmatium globosum TaxID=329046 RepID=A0A1Y2CQM1_9FUNG|nr:hypothetical protein BCR33DRAFT_580272 [Rhizoclosmatium globosum]|eukprot:ORY49331.1 hypothetical protein BCR33DRAFT_580272 [Rhizoclosmatium globosum]
MLTFYPLKNTRRKLFKAILVAALISVMSLGIIPIRSKAGSKTSQLVFSQLNNNTINTDVIKINIHIFHKENMAKLDHLWTSINAANPIDSPVTFKFHAKSIKNHEKLKSFLKNLRSHHGDVSLIEMLDRKQSIKSAMINAWYPKSKHEFAIFLDSNLLSRLTSWSTRSKQYSNISSNQIMNRSTVLEYHCIIYVMIMFMKESGMRQWRFSLHMLFSYLKFIRLFLPHSLGYNSESGSRTSLQTITL